MRTAIYKFVKRNSIAVQFRGASFGSGVDHPSQRRHLSHHDSDHQITFATSPRALYSRQQAWFSSSTGRRFIPRQSESGINSIKASTASPTTRTATEPQKQEEYSFVLVDDAKESRGNNIRSKESSQEADKRATLNRKTTTSSTSSSQEKPQQQQSDRNKGQAQKNQTKIRPAPFQMYQGTWDLSSHISNAKTTEDMIAKLRKAADTLETMSKHDDIEFDFESATREGTNHYYQSVLHITSNAKSARKYNMNAMDGEVMESFNDELMNMSPDQMKAAEQLLADMDEAELDKLMKEMGEEMEVEEGSPPSSLAEDLKQFQSQLKKRIPSRTRPRRTGRR